ncbi:hypothetical protein Dimus_012911 [Dionaea muscipula]
MQASLDTSVYTRNCFKKFKADWDVIWRFKIEEEARNHDLWRFHVKTRDKVQGYKQQFVVKLHPITLAAMDIGSMLQMEMISVVHVAGKDLQGHVLLIS